MIDIETEIAQRLSALIGLDVSWLSHAGDMLTVQFGPQRQYTTRRGKVLEGGAWALHVQCNWMLECAGKIEANCDDLRGSDERAHATAQRLRKLLIAQGSVIVESIAADSMAGGFTLSLANGFRLCVIPDGIEGDEDWRLFAPGVDAPHFVIEGGKVAAD